MTTYNSYEAAKIANPESDIYPHGDRFTTIGSALITGTKCNPDKHCMSMLTFHELDHKLIDGDLYQNEKGRVITVGALGFKEKHCNLLGYYVDPSKTYILRASALEDIPTETPEEKEVLDGIESAGEVEWNGDGLPPVGAIYTLDPNYDIEFLCKYSSEYVVVGEMLPEETYRGMEVIVDTMTQRDRTFRKPETTQQREYRERLEAIDAMCWDVHSLKVSQASALYEAGYRKEKPHGTN